MAFLSNGVPRLADPFASLTASPASGRRQPWLVEFLKSPFQDIDSRATYWLEQKRQAALAAAASRSGDAVGAGD
jgi:hypothetical protein